MFCHVIDDKSACAVFENNAQNQLLIRFLDPSYVRSETILFDPDTRAVHAVLHESMHFVGHVPEEMLARFATLQEISLSADHYSGAPVTLRAPVSVWKN